MRMLFRQIDSIKIELDGGECKTETRAKYRGPSPFDSAQGQDDNCFTNDAVCVCQKSVVTSLSRLDL